MSFTVAQIADRICNLANLPQQTSYVGNVSRNAQVVVNAIEDAANDVFRAFNWTSVTIRESITHVNGTASYALEDDFDRYVQESMWDDTNDRMIRGPMSVQQFEALQSSVGATAVNYYYFRIKRSTSNPRLYMAEFFPVPTASADIYYSYITKNYIYSASGPTSSITDDSDEFLIDDQLVKLNATWRVLKKVGLNYVDEKMDYQIALQEREARDGGSKVLNMEGEAPSAMLGAANIPQTGFGQ